MTTKAIISDLPESAFERFGELVAAGEPGECWEWQGNRIRENGYGRLTITVEINKYVQIYAHRIALHLAGIELGFQDKVLHSCDNPPCCNPYHLRPGTQADNVWDRDERGRRTALRGEAVAVAKLTAETVRQARAEYARGTISMRALAEKHGVCYQTIQSALHYRTWRHV